MFTSEYLSKDILEDAYIKSFAPFRYMEMLLGTSRIHLRDRFVTGPTQPQKIYSLMCAAIILVSYCYVGLTYFQKFYEYTTLYYTFIIVAAIHYIVFACNIIHSRFINTESNPKFYIQMQEIDRLMRVDQGCLNNIMFVNNLFIVILATIIISLVFVGALSLHYLLALGFVGVFFAVLSCAIEWQHCASLIIYFFLRMRYINAIILNHLDGKFISTDLKHRILPTKAFMRNLVSKTHEFETSPVDVYVEALFSAFLAFQKIYRFQILLFCSHFLTHTLISFEIEILSAQKGLIHAGSWLEFLDLPTITILNLIIAVVMSVRYEVFHQEVKLTKRLCVTLLSRHSDGPLREKAKRILRATSISPPYFCVYGMWRMDAAALLALVNTATTLMVALLQFAVL